MRFPETSIWLYIRKSATYKKKTEIIYLRTKNQVIHILTQLNLCINLSVHFSAPCWYSQDQTKPTTTKFEQNIFIRGQLKLIRSCSNSNNIYNNQNETCPTDSSNSVGSASLSLWIFFLDVYILTTVDREELCELKFVSFIKMKVRRKHLTTSMA